MKAGKILATLTFCTLPIYACDPEKSISIAKLTTEDLIQSLQDSYRKDAPPFLQEQRLSFAKRKYFCELKLLNMIFFPKYWNNPDLATNEELLKVKLQRLGIALVKGAAPYMEDKSQLNEKIQKMMNTLPMLRESLKQDVQAAYAGDPAAKNYAEIIRCYPGFLCMLVQRVAHELYQLEIPGYPRELTELVRQLTDIDIHPGATIGDHFFIDHGNGTVIGETCTIGNWCRLYQGVTLGALHFQQDEETQTLKKGYKRHPTLGNHVVVGAGAKILGNISIGDHVSIGANCWVKTDVAPHRTVYIGQHPQQVEKEHKE